MNSIRNWYLNNQTQITWFLIGALLAQGSYEIAEGKFFDASISFFLAALNYGVGRK